ncbi:phage tail protein [Brucella tritici]|uniref:DUF2793 domain-containing protein n=1 Tax=Brucella tritici TaxID=94626 RepID=A0A6L3YEV3_9HYPH|nr:phage tail protein [Brucella tritici]KAB2679839.1 DUF2793 domain-containing protein [Brucella tritici]
MAQNTFALMTNLGRAKEAAALANGTSVVITHIAIGDGATVPSGGETALYHEIARKAISGHGTVVGASNVAYFDIFLEAAEGPYTIREAGLIDQDGDLIAIARYDPPISKPIPSSGQTVEGTIRLEIAFSNIAAITIVVDPAYKVALQRINRLPWLPVLSMDVVAPPATPAVGDVYVVPTGATGAWTGQSGKIAEYTSAGWGILSPPDGHGVSLPDGRVFERVGGTYVEKLALDAQSGKWVAAADNGVANALVVAIDPVPSALPAFLVVSPKVSNNGPATIKVNGLTAVSIKRRNNAALLEGDLQPGTPAFLLLSNGAYILANPLLPPPPGTGLSGRQSFTGWKPVSAASHDLTVTFTAPASGMVIAISTLNKSYNSADPNILNSIAITGVGAEGDWVNTSTSAINATSVQKGQSVTVTSNVQTEAGIAVPMSQYLTYIFIPA